MNISLTGGWEGEAYKIPTKDMFDFIQRIDNEIRLNVFSNILTTMDLSISVNGDHFEHLLYTHFYEIKL
jgi:hypothetical protein